MKLDLRKIPAIYINLDRHEEKNKSMRDLLKQCGFENIIRVKGCDRPDNPAAGIAKSQYDAMREIDPPFIIFEDDCAINKFRYEIEIPDDADAVHLGISQWARYLNFSGPFVHYKVIDDSIVKIYNMLAAHAVLYLSKNYVDICSRVADYWHSIEEPFDVGITEIQKYYNVYAMNNPFFKQNSYNEKVTSCKVTDVGIDVSKSSEFFDRVKYDLSKLKEYKDLNDVSSIYYPLKMV